eukprot:4851010-Alexandrium_andersonii.AAC.1
MGTPGPRECQLLGGICSGGRKGIRLHPAGPQGCKFKMSTLRARRRAIQQRAFLLRALATR